MMKLKNSFDYICELITLGKHSFMAIEIAIMLCIVFDYESYKSALPSAYILHTLKRNAKGSAH